jgi:hypothetical protein
MSSETWQEGKSGEIQGIKIMVGKMTDQSGFGKYPAVRREEISFNVNLLKSFKKEYREVEESWGEGGKPVLVDPWIKVAYCIHSSLVSLHV